jgi:hypothetical protein
MAYTCIMNLFLNVKFSLVTVVIIKHMNGHDVCGTWVVIKFRFTIPPITMGVPVIFNDFIECNGGCFDPV